MYPWRRGCESEALAAVLHATGAEQASRIASSHKGHTAESHLN